MSEPLVSLLFGERAEAYRHPDPSRAVALVTPHETISFARLAEEIEAVATLASTNLSSHARILITMHDAEAVIKNWLGCLAAGHTPAAVPLLVNEIELQEFITACNADVILCDQQSQVVLRTLRHGNSKVVRSLGRLKDEEFACPLSPEIRRSVSFSAGTVTPPRATLHRYDRLDHLLHFYHETLSLSPGSLIYTPGFTAGSMQELVLAPLVAGIGVMVSSRWPSTREVTRALEIHCPQVVIAPVSFYRYLLRTFEPEVLHAVSTTSQRYLAFGEDIDQKLYQRWFGVTGKPLISLYALSEASGFLLTGKITDADFATSTTMSPMFPEGVTTVSHAASPFPGDSTPVTLEITAAAVAERYLDKTNWPRLTPGSSMLKSWDYFTGTQASGFRFLSKSELTWKYLGKMHYGMQIEKEIAETFPIIQGAFLMPSEAPTAPDHEWIFAFTRSPGARTETKELVTEYLQERLPFLRCRVVEMPSLPQSAFAKTRRRPYADIGVATYK
ncbi:MAG: AMP-binding protein [Alphaproteobacteria bacterium]|nr:AMP-binding protein [Alphaproteobacteria bacterium]